MLPVSTLRAVSLRAPVMFEDLDHSDFNSRKHLHLRRSSSKRRPIWETNTETSDRLTDADAAPPHLLVTALGRFRSLVTASWTAPVALRAEASSNARRIHFCWTAMCISLVSCHSPGSTSTAETRRFRRVSGVRRFRGPLRRGPKREKGVVSW